MVCGISRYKSPVELWMNKTDENGNVGPGVASDGHVMLYLKHILVGDRILPLASLVSRSGLGLICWSSMMKPVNSWRLSPRKSRELKIC